MNAASTENKNVIEVKGLFKSFNMGTLHLEVLKGVNLTINHGEFVSIMGESGSGKSTLLYLLGIMDRPTKGAIFIDGKDVSHLNDKKQSIMRRRHLGFIFQFYNLIPNLNVEENVLLPVLLDRQNTRKYSEKLDHLLELVGLADRKNHTPKELSGGQQQRVAIARALINEPEIILADEATGNLDSKTSNEIMELLKKINIKNKKTIIQVTHSNKAAEYGERIIILKDGKIVNNGKN